MKLVDFINGRMAVINTLWRKYDAARGDEVLRDTYAQQIKMAWCGAPMFGAHPAKAPWLTWFGEWMRVNGCLAPEDEAVLKGIECDDYKRAIPALADIVRRRHQIGYDFNYNMLGLSRHAEENRKHYRFLYEVLHGVASAAHRAGVKVECGNLPSKPI